MPALFVFFCFIALIKTKRQAYLVGFIPIAILFKETAILLVVAFLFWEDVPFRRRLYFLGITLLISLVVKAGVDLLTANPSPVVTMTFTYTGVPLFVNNLKLLFALRSDSAFFIDAGLVLSLLLLPIKNQEIAMLKLIAVLFIIGIFLAGVIVEYRIWFELIPISLYGLSIYFYSSGKAEPLPDN